MDTRQLTRAFNDFHALACERLGIGPKARGARKRVADDLGVTPQQYSDALHGRRRSLETLAEWSKKLGFEVTYQPSGQIVVQPSEVHPVDRDQVIEALRAFEVPLAEWVRRIRQQDPHQAGHMLRRLDATPAADEATLQDDLLDVVGQHRDHAVLLYLAAERRFAAQGPALQRLQASLRVRPQDDPLYEQLRASSKVVLLVSVDLVRSKQLKRHGAAVYDRPWITTYSKFYRWVTQQLPSAYEALPADLIDRVQARRLELLRVDDDDLTFSVEIRHPADVLVHVRAALELVTGFNGRNPLGLSCKATAWLCGIPITDLEVSDRSKHYVAYAGPNMDVGRALRSWAEAERMPVSFELAMMLADGLADVPDAGIGIDPIERHALDAVVIPDRYPKIMVTLGAMLSPLDDRMAELTTYAEQQGFERWFLTAAAPGTPYAGPTLQWLRRYRAMLDSREEERDPSLQSEVAPGGRDAPIGIVMPLIPSV